MSKSEDVPEVPHVFIRGEGGAIFKMDLPLHETIENRLLKGYIARVNEDGGPYVEGKDDVPATPTERPALNASKATWVGWAVHEGMTPDAAEALTKTDLIEKFGATPKVEVPAGTPEAITPADDVKDAGSETPEGEGDQPEPAAGTPEA